MLNGLLGQTTAATSTAPSPEGVAAAPVFEWSAWAPTGADVLRGAGVFAGTVIVGLVLMLLLRHVIRRLKLGVPSAVAVVAMAFYFAVLAYRFERFTVPFDYLAFWITRVFAAAMLFAGLRFVDRLAIIPLLTRGGRVALARFVHQIIFILLSLFAIVIYGSMAFGWDIDRFLAGSAVVSIVLGLALQESLGNFFSGLVMQASPPFAIGNWIVCGGHEGRVVDMTWRAVTIHTSDDNFIVIPNATVAKAEIINFHAPTKATARSLKVGLDYDVAPCDAIAVLKTAAVETAGVQQEPAPFVYVDDFTDAAVLYRVKFWINDPAAHPKIEHAVRQNIWYRLHGRGFGIPFPTFNIEHISLEEKNRNLQDRARGYRMAAIESVPLFGVLSAEQKRQLADSTDDYLLSPGQVLFRQGEEGDSFYIVRKGTVEVLVRPEGGGGGGEERVVATLGPGDFFGEMSALTGQPRTATIRAATAIALVRVEKRDLHALFEADRSLLEKISEVVARRNAEREAVLQGAGAKPNAEAVKGQQRTLLGRMMGFFGLAA